MKSIISYLFESKNNFEIIPHKSTDKIIFGMDRLKVRKLYNSPFKEFLKTKLSKNTTDAFDELGFHVFYDKENRCEAVEYFDNSNLSYKTILFFDSNPKELKSRLEKIDINISINGNTLDSPKLGISVYSDSGFNNKDGKIDSVLVFGKTYI